MDSESGYNLNRLQTGGEVKIINPNPESSTYWTTEDKGILMEPIQASLSVYAI